MPETTRASMDGASEKTRLFHRTMEALEAALTAELVGSSFAEGGIFSESAPSDELVTWACAPQRSYSRVPLGESSTPPRIVGVAEVDIPGRSVSCRRTIALDDVLSASTSISHLIALLSRRRFYFLLRGSHIEQIVTISDLNRLPVRVYLFTILSHLEGVLADMIVEEFPADEWLAQLPDGQQAKVSDLFAMKRAVEVDTRLIDCTMLTHKFALIAKNPGLRQRFGTRAKGEFERYVRPVRDLRDRLLHEMDPIDGSGAEHLESARDAVAHGSPVSRRRDPAWLAGVNATIHKMIAAAASETGDEEVP